MQNHGTDPSTRFKLMRERVEAMKAIWTQDEASYHGELVDFDPIWSWPKPVQKPHPPILMGGGGPRVLDRVLDYARRLGAERTAVRACSPSATRSCSGAPPSWAVRTSRSASSSASRTTTCSSGWMRSASIAR